MAEKPTDAGQGQEGTTVLGGGHAEDEEVQTVVEHLGSVGQVAEDPKFEGERG